MMYSTKTLSSYSIAGYKFLEPLIRIIHQILDQSHTESYIHLLSSSAPRDSISIWNKFIGFNNNFLS
ncbi:hypothetical protein F7725_024970 [Dissostichus mawsoni]|uniref:Uncharacterized protein n=1 Tax=Dissostichus mawsoni TaxID=36200 RepID=A0A7J5X9T0_DISMA|nr:hypothetical protein F7725_024970 [Dissostichus mawsoni]